MESVMFGIHRLIHMDLKGAPPKVGYLEKLFPVLRRWGATGILIEWEDTFPYTNELQLIGGNSEISSVLNAPYTHQEVLQILQMAQENDLLVIQLIQTIGHLEFILKHPTWSSLREVPDFPSSMCPSHDGALPLIRSVLTQALSIQKDAQYIHIGADEVWHITQCATCIRRASESKYGQASLFLDHISALLRRASESKYGQASLFLDHISALTTFLKETHPHLKVLMWDDMIRGIDVRTLQAYDLGSLVEPMIWHYNSLETFNLGTQLWDKYYEVFNAVWIASAFKGATGSCQVLPVIKHHITNHVAWLKEVERNNGKIKKLMGIALTGWSRYDHYATLCELLPVALPSLAYCLQTWMTCDPEQSDTERETDLRATSQVLGFNPDKALPMEVGSFPGWQICKAVHAFTLLRARYRDLAFGDLVQTWLNPWQVQNRYTNPMQIGSVVPAANELLAEATSLELYMQSHMEPVYHSHTVEEWLGSNLTPITSHLRQIRSDAEFQLNLGCCVRGLKTMF